MKKRTIMVPVFFLVLAVAFMNCDSKDDGGSVGGLGAEFDPSLYYTQTEVDTLLTTVVTTTGLANDTITGNDFAGGTETGWVAPDSAKAAIFELSLYNSDSESDSLTTYIEVSNSDTTGAEMGTSITVPADGTYYSKIFYVPVQGGNTIVAYHPYSAGHSGITDLATISNFEINVKPM